MNTTNSITFSNDSLDESICNIGQNLFGKKPHTMSVPKPVVKLEERVVKLAEKKETENKPITLNVWRIDSVSIYPHLEFGILYTYEELKKIALDIKKELFGEFMTIYETNSYCSEVNGFWNVCFSININPTGQNSSGKNFTYMLRRDIGCGKSYGCPFRHADYGDIMHYSFGHSECSQELKKLEQYLMRTLNQPKKIDCFPC